MSLKFASLFCGCGGFDLGFIKTGFECVAAFDLDQLAVRVHKHNLKSPVSILDLSRCSIPDSLPTIDVLLAGPPCQGFSMAGTRKLDDPRNELLITAGEVATKLRPKVILIENVTGVTSGAHKQYWKSLKYTLKENGYRTFDFLSEAIKMGVPQIRKRMFMLACLYSKEINIRLPNIPGGDLLSALVGVEKAPNHFPKYLPQRCNLAKIARHIKPGQKLCNVRGGPTAVHTWDIPEVYGRVTKRERSLLEVLLRIRRRRRKRDFGDADPVSARVLASELGFPVKEVLMLLMKKNYIRKVGGEYDLTHTFNGKFRRLRWNKPSLTVDTRFGNPRYFLHPSENRGFTVREAARLQGFPDSFLFEGSETSQYRLIGNAVPPPLAECFGRFIKEIFFED